jgi:hypothetical protein
MKSSCAMSALSLPEASSRRTWISRSDRPAPAGPGISSGTSCWSARSLVRSFDAIGGEMSDSPAAAARMPVTISSTDASLSR